MSEYRIGGYLEISQRLGVAVTSKMERRMALLDIYIFLSFSRPISLIELDEGLIRYNFCFLRSLQET